MKAEIVPLTPELIARAAPRVQLFHEEDVTARHGLTARGLAESALARSMHAWAGLVDGEPVCLFGLVAESFTSDTAMPWLLATPELAHHAKAFWKGSRHMVAAMLALYPRLVAHCQADFPQSLAWLKRLGFREIEPGSEFTVLELRRV